MTDTPDAINRLPTEIMPAHVSRLIARARAVGERGREGDDAFVSSAAMISRPGVNQAAVSSGDRGSVSKVATRSAIPDCRSRQSLRQQRALPGGLCKDPC